MKDTLFEEQASAISSCGFRKILSENLHYSQKNLVFSVWKGHWKGQYSWKMWTASVDNVTKRAC